MNGKPQDVVVWVDPGKQRKKQLSGAAMGLLILALGVGCVAMAISEKTPLPLVSLVVVGIAMFGWYRGQHEANARAKSSATINPALIVDDTGVGDAAVRIPWRDIARVNVVSTHYGSVGPESVGLGRELADKWTNSTGVMDGEFELQVVLRRGISTRSALDRYRTYTAPSDLPRGIYAVDAIGMDFRLGSAVPRPWRESLARQIEDNVRFRGVAFGPRPT